MLKHTCTSAVTNSW